jgi:molybdopterin-binding protein
MELYKLQDAAKLLSISYPTLKNWIYKGKINPIKTEGGHYRIPRSEVDRLTGNKAMNAEQSIAPIGLSSISGRNKLKGIVTQVKHEGLLSQVTIDLGGQFITSIITRDACEELGLKPGVVAFALVKATEVMVIRG